MPTSPAVAIPPPRAGPPVLRRADNAPASLPGEDAVGAVGAVGAVDGGGGGGGGEAGAGAPGAEAGAGPAGGEPGDGEGCSIEAILLRISGGVVGSLSSDWSMYIRS